jgi:hypothetical protein
MYTAYCRLEDYLGRDGLRGPGNVVGFIGHALSSGAGIRSESHLCTFSRVKVHSRRERADGFTVPFIS